MPLVAVNKVADSEERHERHDEHVQLQQQLAEPSPQHGPCGVRERECHAGEDGSDDAENTTLPP
jgi:hypothetical protein